MATSIPADAVPVAVEDDDLVAGFLGVLGEIDASALMMYLDGLSAGAMSEVLGISANAINVRIKGIGVLIGAITHDPATPAPWTYYGISAAVLAVLALPPRVREFAPLLARMQATGAPVHVRYAAPRFSVDIGTPPICPLGNSPPQVRPNVGNLRSPAGWMPAAGVTVDVEKCEASYVLEAGIAALIYRNGFCDDYDRHANQGAAFRPSLEYLILENRAGVREWHRWDAVAQFKRAPSGSCMLRVDELP